jgi:hypothetical protein
MKAIYRAVAVGLGVSGFGVGCLSTMALPHIITGFPHWPFVTMIVVGFASIPLAISVWISADEV